MSSSVRLRHVLRPVEEVNYGGLEVLSVYREHGVVPKASRTDNFNATPRDLSRYQRVLEGDLVVNKMKAWSGSVGVSRYEGIVSPDYLVCRVSGQVHPGYLHHLLRSRRIVAEMHKRSKGIRPSQERLYWEDLGDIKIALPALDEQRRIAGFLDNQVALLDRALALRLVQADLVRQRMAGTVADILTGNSGADLAATGDRWFPRLPPAWRVVPLKYRWQVIDCKHRTPAYVDQGYPLVSTGDIKPGRLDLSRTTRFVSEADYVDLADHLRRPVRGDIVYSRNASIGTACYVDTDEPFTMGQDVCRITSGASDHLFLAHALNYLVAPQIEVEKVGSTFSRINVERILNLKIPYPPEGAQRHLALAADAVISMAQTASTALTRSSQLLQERKQALIAAAVVGDLDVTTARSAA